MTSRPEQVQQIDLTKLSLQQLQQLKNEFESVSVPDEIQLERLHATNIF